MACFLVPMVLAIMTSILQKTTRSLAEKLKLWILNTLLWGGVMLLAIEHIVRGEIVPWPPFLTAMTNPAQIPVMLHEIAIIGTAMSIATFVTWGIILAISHYMPKIVKLKSYGAVKKPYTAQ